MQLRAFLIHSRAGRVLCVAVLALFLILCGVHIGSAHHDGDGDSFGLAAQVILLVAVAVALLLVAKATGQRGLAAVDPSSDWVAAPLREPPSVDLSLPTPLLC